MPSHPGLPRTGLLCVLLASACARGTTLFEDASVSPGQDADGGAPSGDEGEDAGGLLPHEPEPDGSAALPSSEPDAAPAEHDAGTEPAAPDCQPGTYGGTFSGTISVLGFLNIPISGTISIGALSSTDGEVLNIDDGKVTGTDQDGNPVSADVFGLLRCATRQLEGGELRNGVYVRENINQTVNFEGTVEATYVPGTMPRVMGSWRTQGGLEMGTGPFDAVLVP
jgi:hypothetical protein